MPIYMKMDSTYDYRLESVSSGPGDENPLASGPGDENPVASGPGDELTLKSESTDDAFAIDWLAEDHAYSDPSDGLKPTESLLPMESLRVDPSDPSLDPLIAEFELAAAETTDTGHSATLGWELRYAYATPLE